MLYIQVELTIQKGWIFHHHEWNTPGHSVKEVEKRQISKNNTAYTLTSLSHSLRIA